MSIRYTAGALSLSPKTSFQCTTIYNRSNGTRLWQETFRLWELKVYYNCLWLGRGFARRPTGWLRVSGSSFSAR